MKKYYTLLICCFGLLNIVAQEPLSLAQAISLGLQNNYQIQIANKQIQLAQNNNTWKAAGRYPTVNANLSSQNTFSDANTPASFLTKSQSWNADINGSLEANYTLFDGYKVKISKERLATLEQQSQGNLKVAIENTVRAIMLAYYQALIQKEQIKVLEEVLVLSKDRIRQQEILKEYGQASNFDIIQTQDAYLNDSTTYLLQINTYETALRNLNLAMGVKDWTKEYGLSDPLVAPSSTYIFEDLETKMFAENQDLQNLFINRALTTIESRFQDSNRYPVVGVNAGISQNINLNYLDATNPFTMEQFGGSVGRTFRAYANISATYNIYNGGNTARAIENAKVQEHIAQLNIESLKQNLSTQLANTLMNYNNQLELLALTKNLLENANKNLEISKQRFDAGQINSFDYRAIQLSYINASQARLNAIFNLKNTETELIRLIGGLVR